MDGPGQVDQVVAASGRISTAEEVATPVALLASPRTGTGYLIDGGLVKTL